MRPATLHRALPAALALILACGGPQEPEVRTVQSPPLLDLTVPPEPGAPRPFELPPTRVVELDNGLDLVLIDRPGFPTLSAELSIDAGYATTGDIAVSELVARLLRDGAGDWDAAALSRVIDAKGIRYSASVNHDRTRLSAQALSTNADVLIDVLATLVSTPTFAEDRVAARREELRGELELEASQPSFHLQRTIRRAVFPADHPYSRAFAELDRVDAVGRADVTQAWEAHYGPSIARLVLVGDLPDDAAERLGEAFGGWDGGPTATAEIPDVDVETCNVAHVVIRPNSAQTSIAWLGPGVRTDAEGWFDALVANQVLGGGASARLFMNLREDKSYTYGAYSGLEQWADGVFRASSDVRGEVTGPALDEFVYELDRFAEDPLADDVDDATAYLTGVFPIEHQTNAQIASAVARLLDRGIDLDYLERYRRAVSSVDEQGVRDAGAELFARPELALVLVGEEEIVVPAAVERASRVFVYDLDGERTAELAGTLDSTCGADGP